MADMIYKELVVQWVAVEIDEGDEDMPPYELEEKYRDRAMETIALNGWDGAECLENSFYHKEQ